MPELPEVETTRRGILPHLKDRKLVDLQVRQAGLRWPVPADLDRCILTRTLRHISRRGKYLLFDFGTGHMLVHLGMSGSLRIVERREPARFHDHLDFDFGPNRVLRFHDPRRFGAVLWVGSSWQQHSLLKHLGPEPLGEGFDGDYLYECSRRRKLPVKSFIMDSRVVVGVGNIYANEALFKAGIRPSRRAGAISRQRYRVLAGEIRQTLSAAIEQGGTTLRDFIGGDGRPGYFQQQLLVYGRAGQLCKRCSGQLIESRIGQRSTVYCRTCQS